MKVCGVFVIFVCVCVSVLCVRYVRVCVFIDFVCVMCIWMRVFVCVKVCLYVSVCFVR